MSDVRAIDANALKEIWELYKKYQPSLATNVYEFGVALKGLIDNAQTVESERAKGEWIRICSLGNGNSQYECSECHYGDEHAESQEVPYCWHCGADMRGKTDA